METVLDECGTGVELNQLKIGLFVPGTHLQFLGKDIN